MKNLLLLLLLTSCLVWADDESAGQKEPSSSGIDIIGIWDQYIYYYKDGEYAYHYACTVEVYKEKDKPEYQIRFMANTKNPEIIHSVGVYDIQFDGKTWTFYSDWKEYGLGYFKLEIKKPNVFEGYSYSTDEKKKPLEKLSPNRFIRHDL